MLSKAPSIRSRIEDGCIMRKEQAMMMILQRHLIRAHVIDGGGKARTEERKRS